MIVKNFGRSASYFGIVHTDKEYYVKTGNMRQIKIKEIKEISLNGLIAFTTLCDQFQLQYYLAFGSLIGAVRHRGFIPWDDDIDLLMPREDYEKLRSLTTAFETEEWELFSYSTKQGFLMPYMKYCNRDTLVLPSRFNSGLVYGISIDIFPLDFFDGTSVREVEEKIADMRNRIRVLERAACKSAAYKRGILRPLKYILKKASFLLHPERVKRLIEEYKRLDAEMAKNSEKGGQFAAFVLSPYENIWFSSDFIGDGDQCSKLQFEERFFSAPYNPDAVLKKTYGDYMQLPSLPQRVSNHSFTAFEK